MQPKDSASAVVEDGDSVEPPTEEVDEADEEIIEIVADAVEQTDDNDDLHAQLISAVTKITSCYEGAEAQTQFMTYRSSSTQKITKTFVQTLPKCGMDYSVFIKRRASVLITK